MSAAARARATTLLVVLTGLALTVLVGLGAQQWAAPRLIGLLQAEARAAIAGAGGQGISARFTDAQGELTRHPQLVGGANLPAPVRAGVAQAVARQHGMGGVHWLTGPGQLPTAPSTPTTPDCQTHVEAILATRTIRFSEASAAIDPASRELLDEVADALRPCAGSVIAITGHTNTTGDEEVNERLSQARAVAVRNALAARGIDMAGLRARGVGSQRPLPRLDPSDPANRRIEFAVIAPVSLEPTVIDTPGAQERAGGAAVTPLWFEIQVLLALTFAGGLAIGWGLWGGARRARPAPVSTDTAQEEQA